MYNFSVSKINSQKCIFDFVLMEVFFWFKGNIGSSMNTWKYSRRYNGVDVAATVVVKMGACQLHTNELAINNMYGNSRREYTIV